MNINRSKLGEIATVEISGVDKKIKDGEIPVKLCNFVDVYYNWAITSDMEKEFMEVTARPNEIERFKLKRGQVALTKDSETRFDIGIATYIADDFDNVILGYHNALITPSPEKLCGKYLNALLHTDYARTYFANNASGSGQRYALSVDALNNFPVPLIPLAEQERIGDIFSSIDQKIALNRAINDNLEAMAKQLYDYWFVQFDFPNEEGKPYKSSGGKMVWNEKLKREIPEGWEVLLVGDILDKVQNTPRLVTNEYMTNGLYPIIDQTANIYYAGFTDREDAVSKQFPAVVFGDHSCAVKYVNFPFVRGADGTQIMLSKDDRISIEYLYFAIKNIPLREGYARHYSILKESYIIAPSISIAKLYHGFAAQQFEMITSNRKEIIALSKQRDELLPLLMNGQVSPLNSD